ncbi:hypothetical protein J5N97_020072 [Dioscorea zingiberensis]|uniref:Dirigent protein n=1 Tax=Dioscorea zingiberensis TaxID=325984 RepID=A0A9D5CGB0_9LILI|nr:hypothetical protein J5N97_020072 [Dioscorea zingiberensis]
MYMDRTTRQVLVMEWVEGQKLSEVKDLYLVEVGVYCSLSQLLEHGFYHADPHHGNLLRSSDGKLAYLDFGIMGEFKQELQDGFIEACLHLVNRDLMHWQMISLLLGYNYFSMTGFIIQAGFPKEEKGLFIEDATNVNLALEMKDMGVVGIDLSGNPEVGECEEKERVSLIHSYSNAFKGFSAMLIKKRSLLLSVSAINAGEEVETHIQVYFNDIVSGPNYTAIRVAEASTTNISRTNFGAVVVIDDPLTESPDPSSKLIGRAQGMYALASQEEYGLLMAMNLAFIDGEFNGSTLAVLGRNAVFSEVREMPIVGGSGRFRLARGYVLAKTYKFDRITGDTIVEWNIHVLHYS